MADVELIFNLILILEFSAFSILRIIYQLKAQKAGYRTVIKEGHIYPIFLSIFICYEVFTFFLYLLYPQAISWASIPMQPWLRSIGIFLGLLALFLFMWVHVNLGNNYSIRLRVAEQQVIIASGPYKWIRHPMYTAFYVLHVAVFFLTANWFLGLTWIIGLTALIFVRVKKEEAMMIEKFGDKYRLYIRNTGRFLPYF